MSSYQIKKTPKTKFINLFRTVFTLPLFEDALVALTSKSRSPLLRKFVPPNYLYKKESFRTITRENIKYKLDISNVVDHYLYFGLEDPVYTSVLETIQNAKTILDIGANIGTTSLYFASLNAKAKIISFEPHPDTFKRAEENIKLNSFRNIELLNIGLGEQKAELKLYEVNENNPGMNRILAEETNLPYKIIQVDLLDKIMEEKSIPPVDFIKIDVEGFEYSVLKGGVNTLKNKPVLFIELDDNNLRENNSTAEELIKLLYTIGYSRFYRADTSEAVSTTTDFSHCHFDLIAK
ncbi:MAG: FkbM family methyltransferase [Bacteroidetes bacterium]|jgi:FkbM family methyltransferase|nr:FkbM family methyltransferase [Bacteroidota bacterium]